MMEQQKTRDHDCSNSMECGNEELEPASQGFMLDHTSSINSNARPPELKFSETKPVLNYSIQTGEEFALEFMRDRVNLKKPFIPNTGGDPNYTTGYLELKGILGISHTGSESGSEKGPKEFEQKNSLYEDKSNHSSVQSISETKWDYSSYRGTVRQYASSGASESSSTKIKILCSFGGRILPRPSDGKLRYVGGETRIIRISKDISWLELWRKTVSIYDETHTIKYQLPGEDLDALVSVSSDEDLQNMMEESNVLQDGEGSKKLRMFLFSLSDLEDGHFGLGNHDGDSEIQFVVAVNGMNVGSRKNSTMHGLASSSGNNLDELDGQNVERDTGGSVTNFVDVSTAPLKSYMVSSSATQPSQLFLPSFSNTCEKHSQFYNGQMMHHAETKQYPMPYGHDSRHSNHSPFGESSGPLPLNGLATQEKGLTEGHHSNVSSIQDPQMQVNDLKAKADGLVQQEGRDDYIQPLSKDYHVPSQQLDGKVKDHFLVEEESSAISTLDEELKSLKSEGRHQEPAQVSSPLWDINPAQVPRADDDVFHTSSGAYTAGCGNSESDPIDLSYLEPPVPPQRVFYSERIPREQAELLNRLSKSDDSLGSQFLINHLHSDAAPQDIVTESIHRQTEKQSIPAAKPLYKDPDTSNDGAPQLQNLNQPAPNPLDDKYAINEDRILTDENETNGNGKDENVLVCETSEAVTEFPTASQVAPVKNDEKPSYGLPGPHRSDIPSSNFTTNNTQGHDQPSAWMESSVEPSVGVSGSIGGDILIDINDRFPRDFLSDIFSKAVLSEGSSGISPLQKDGTGLSLNIENQDPKHWSFFQKLAGDEFSRKDVSLIDQGHIGFSSGLPKVEEESPISYKFTPLTTDDVSLSHVDSHMKYGGDDQKEIPGTDTIGADTADYSPQIKISEVMQSDNFVVNPSALDSEYEVLNHCLKYEIVLLSMLMQSYLLIIFMISGWNREYWPTSSRFLPARF